jgi:hypothetical protein
MTDERFASDLEAEPKPDHRSNLKPRPYTRRTIMNPNPDLYRDSAGWLFFVKASFVLAAATLLIGIYVLPTDWWVKGFLYMGEIYVIGASITLAKTVRDQHEADKLINKITHARTEKMLSELDEP